MARTDIIRIAFWRPPSILEEEIPVDAFERVKKIVVEQLGVQEDKVTREAKFREDLEADSIDLVELIVGFEEEFGGSISDEVAQKIVTVGDAVDLVETMVA
jgi:acyl carrier protein